MLSNYLMSNLGIKSYDTVVQVHVFSCCIYNIGSFVYCYIQHQLLAWDFVFIYLSFIPLTIMLTYFSLYHMLAIKLSCILIYFSCASKHTQTSITSIVPPPKLGSTCAWVNLFKRIVDKKITWDGRSVEFFNNKYTKVK